jgi:trigger factor
MKTVETENKGLKRAYKLTIPAKDIDARVDGEIKRIAPTVRMPGFRPGKVPPNLIRKMHGEALMRDALNTPSRTASSGCSATSSCARRCSRRSSSTQI